MLGGLPVVTLEGTGNALEQMQTQTQTQGKLAARGPGLRVPNLVMVHPSTHLGNLPPPHGDGMSS